MAQELIDKMTTKAPKPVAKIQVPGIIQGRARPLFNEVK
jgi:hypothetical protein